MTLSKVRLLSGITRWLFVAELALLITQAGAKELPVDQAKEALQASLNAIQNREIEFSGNRIAAENPKQLEQLENFYKKRYQEIREDDPNAASLKAKLDGEREARLKSYTGTSHTPMSVKVQIRDLNRFTAIQRFLFEGSNPYNYYVDEGVGFLVREESRTVDKLDRTTGTLSIIVPGIPQFWVSKFLASGAVLESADIDGEELLIKLKPNRDLDEACFIKCDSRTLSPTSIKVENKGKIVMKLDAIYDPKNGNVFPSESTLTRYRRDGSIVSEESWKMVQERLIEADQVKSRFAIPKGYFIREKLR